MSVRASAPTWLFSFVDLAFLLLIVFTQLAPSPEPAPLLDFGELPLPQIRSDAIGEIEAGDERWQVRVYPASAEAPFALFSGTPDEAALARVDLVGLSDALVALQQSQGEKPLLAPHEDARAADLLEAAGLIEDAWPGPRRATVTPVPAVAAGPPTS